MKAITLDVRQTLLLLFGISFVSFSVLDFEITLTRISSVVFIYHYAFMAVSMALLGLALGGVVANVFHTKALRDVFRNLSVTSMAFSLSILLLSILVLKIFFVSIYVFSLLMFIPFFVSGLLFATAFKFFAERSNTLYFADLVAAATGSLLVLLLLDQFGAVNTVFLTSTIGSIASICFAIASESKKVVTVALGLLILLSVLSVQNFTYDYVGDVPIGSDVDKELYALLNSTEIGARILRSKWSGFGRTDLIEIEGDPHRKVLFIDGSAATYMYHFDGDLNSSANHLDSLKYSVAYFPFYFGNKENVLIIGPGGGVDVLIALMGGAGQIEAVEVNPDIVDLVRQHSDFNGGIYTRFHNVRVFIDEGRSFLKRSTSRYDIIMLNIPVTKTAQGTSGYSLSENFLFTTESFADYLTHLEKNGRLVVVAHFRPEAYKLTVIASKALGDKGKSIQDIMRQIVIVEGRDGRSVFVLKKSAFTYEEVSNIHIKSHEMGFHPIYLPNVPFLDPLLTAIAYDQLSLSTLVSEFPMNLNPPTDDSPFFYKFERGLPSTLSSLLAGVSLLCLFIVGFYCRFSRSWKRLSWFMPYYFSVLGLGFMLIEVSLIQKLILFLGHPTLAISILLSSLLLSTGIGSFYSRRFGDKLLPYASRISLTVGVIIFLYLFSSPFIISLLLGYDLVVRAVSSAIMIFPSGFLMGSLFPLGIRWIRQASEQAIPWMWCLNGIFSVLGSILAVAIAMLLGFNATLLLGALVYLSIFLISYATEVSSKYR